MTYQFQYNYGLNTWHLAYTPESPVGYPDPEYVLPGVVPDGDWSLYAEMYGVSDGAAMGLMVEAEDGERVALLGAWNFNSEEDENIYIRQHQGTIWLRIDYHSAEGELHLRSATTRGSWEEHLVVSVVTPVDTGLLLRYDNPALRVEGFVTSVALLTSLEEPDGWTEIEVPYARFPELYPDPHLPAVPGITLDVEPTVYALIAAPFGDQEFDIGKSARWLEYFSDKLFALDVNLGDPRYWIVNWTMTFPQAEHSVTSINFFERPVDFRKEQFRKAHKQYNMDDDSWVLWVDGSEGLSFDNSSLPDDYDFLQFMTFIYREVARAEAANQTSVVIPFFVFLRSAEVQNVTYDHPSNSLDGSTPPVLQAISVPYYLPYQGMRRLMKTSVLRDPSFDWTTLDQPSAPSAGVKAQIVSYAYAHWQFFDIPPGQTEVPPLSESNDEGFKMRRRISQVRPIASLPAQAWDPAADPAGVPGPWAGYTLTNTNPDFVPITDAPITAPAAAALGIKTPLYDTVIRLNMRDGVWYEGDVSGNTPMTWDSVNEKWTTPYDPNIWPSTGTRGGVNAPPNPDYVEPPTPV